MDIVVIYLAANMNEIAGVWNHDVINLFPTYSIEK